MLNYIKKTLLSPSRKYLGRTRRKIKNKTVDQISKKILSRKMRVRHAQELERIRKKGRINVVFLAIHESIWKVDTVFQKMLDDNFFNPIILVCPHVQYGHEEMFKDLKKAYDCFSGKGYPVTSSYDKESDSWVKIEDLDPDLIFFTNPHKLTKPEYYEDAFCKYLTCYVPYYYLATSHAGDQLTFNHFFHSAMWRIFMPHQFSMDRARQIAANKAANCVLTGYPSCERLLEKDEGMQCAWKEQKAEKKRIIFAPHHTIKKTGSSLSNFIEYAEFMVKLSIKYRNETQWSFKPHPNLKPKLYIHPDWGKKRTDEYFSFWAFSENSQLDDGEYSELFLQSDAIIHDSSSFIVEYLFVEKPCLYLASDNKQLELINEFGLKALKAYDIARENSDIEAFLISVINGTRNLKDSHTQFLSEEVIPLYGHDSPSDKILRTIKQDISNAIE